MSELTDGLPSRRQRVAVVGAGIAGLAAAWALSRARPDIDVVVLEQSARAGGKLWRRELAGAPIDVGAEALLVRRPEGLRLLAELGLDGEQISPLTTRAGVWSDGGSHPIPAGTVMGIPGDVEKLAASGVLSDDALRRVRAELDNDAAPVEADVAVGDLVAQRLGSEIVERLVDPLLGGVYAGHADRISLQAAVPALAARLRAGGSLVSAAADVAASGARADPSRPVFASLPGGLARLAEEIVAGGGFTLRTSTAVRGIRRSGAGLVLDIGPRPSAETLDVDAVIAAAPAAKAARLLDELAPLAAADLAGIETASVAVASFAYRSAETSLPAGSGLLVPATGGHLVKGVTISSQKWPGGPAGLTYVRASLGRAGEQATLQRDDEDLLAAAGRDLQRLIGAPAHAVDAVLTRWGGGLPQYAVGHRERVARIRANVAQVPGLAVAGATYDGVGIPACIASADAAVERILGELRPISRTGAATA